MRLESKTPQEIKYDMHDLPIRYDILHQLGISAGVQDKAFLLAYFRNTLEFLERHPEISSSPKKDANYFCGRELIRRVNEFNKIPAHLRKNREISEILFDLFIESQK